jgi:hypothetical protein
MTVEAEAAASALVGLETVITSHEDEEEESEEESNRDRSQESDESENIPENDDYGGNEAELFN